jgi:hypothetical protein
MFLFVTHGSIFRETVCLAHCYTRNRVIQYVLSGRFAHSSLTSGDNSPEPHVLALGDWQFEVPRGDHGTMAQWHWGGWKVSSSRRPHPSSAGLRMPSLYQVT